MGKMQWLANGYKENKFGPIFDPNIVSISACNENLETANIVSNVVPILVSNIVSILEANVCRIFEND